MPNKTYLRNIERQMRFYRIFRELDAEMPVGQILFFLAVAAEQDLSSSDICRMLKLKESTGSRYFSQLSKVDRFKEPGLDLVEHYEDPMNRRRKVIVLTEKGKKLVEKLFDKEEKYASV